MGNEVMTLDAIASRLTPSQITLIKTGLRLLAGSDEDGAREINGVGFNKLDTRLGRDLASLPYLSRKQAALGAKLVNKYRRQLPCDVTGPIGDLFKTPSDVPTNRPVERSAKSLERTRR
jgi:hypothetical protein